MGGIAEMKTLWRSKVVAWKWIAWGIAKHINRGHYGFRWIYNGGCLFITAKAPLLFVSKNRCAIKLYAWPYQIVWYYA